VRSQEKTNNGQSNVSRVQMKRLFTYVFFATWKLYWLFRNKYELNDRNWRLYFSTQSSNRKAPKCKNAYVTDRFICSRKNFDSGSVNVSILRKNRFIQNVIFWKFVLMDRHHCSEKSHYTVARSLIVNGGIPVF